jgi:hypothetical protein
LGYQEYCDVVAVEAAGFAVAIKGADPATPVPTCPGSVSYWARRILYEAVVHRADADFTLGVDPVIDARTGADGVDEFLTNLLDFPWVVDQQRDLNRDGQTVHLHATDHDAGWLITLSREGFTWRRGTGAATVSA